MELVRRALNMISIVLDIQDVGASFCRRVGNSQTSVAVVGHLSFVQMATWCRDVGLNTVSSDAAAGSRWKWDSVQLERLEWAVLAALAALATAATSLR